jgi:hypothetical protein
MICVSNADRLTFARVPRLNDTDLRIRSTRAQHLSLLAVPPGHETATKISWERIGGMRVFRIR